MLLRIPVDPPFEGPLVRSPHRRICHKPPPTACPQPLLQGLLTRHSVLPAPRTFSAPSEGSPRRYQPPIFSGPASFSHAVSFSSLSCLNSSSSVQALRAASSLLFSSLQPAPQRPSPVPHLSLTPAPQGASLLSSASTPAWPVPLSLEPSSMTVSQVILGGLSSAPPGASLLPAHTRGSLSLSILSAHLFVALPARPSKAPQGPLSLSRSHQRIFFSSSPRALPALQPASHRLLFKAHPCRMSLASHPGLSCLSPHPSAPLSPAFDPGALLACPVPHQALHGSAHLFSPLPAGLSGLSPCPSSLQPAHLLLASSLLFTHAFTAWLSCSSLLGLPGLNSSERAPLRRSFG